MSWKLNGTSATATQLATMRSDLGVAGREYFPTIANGTDEHDLDIGASRVWVRNSVGLELLVDISAATIAIDGAGLDTGTVANSTWYYIWVMHNPTTNDSIYRLSASATSPTLPSGYTYSRMLCDTIAAAVLTNGSANILGFKTSGRRFMFDSPITNLNSSSPATSSTLLTVSTPAVTCLANLYVAYSAPAVNDLLVMQDADGASTSLFVARTVVAAGAVNDSGLCKSIASQIRYYSSRSGASATIFTIGYEVF